MWFSYVNAKSRQHILTLKFLYVKLFSRYYINYNLLLQHNIVSTSEFSILLTVKCY